MKELNRTNKNDQGETIESTHSQTSVEPKKHDITKRQANCCYGPHGFVDSRPDLIFFKERPNRETDEYYCGCYGWD